MGQSLKKGQKLNGASALFEDLIGIGLGRDRFKFSLPIGFL